MKLFKEIIDIKGIWFRYRKLFRKVVITTVLLVLLGSIAMLLALPTYEATSTLLLRPSKEEIVFAREIGSLVGGDPPSTMTNTYSTIISGRRLCEKTIDRMLKEGYVFEDPEKSGFDLFLENRVKPVMNKLVSLYYVMNYGTFKGFPTPFEKLVDDLQEKLVAEGEMNTYIIQTTLHWKDPVIASDILNQLCKTFTDYHTSQTEDDLREMLDRLNGELTRRDRDLKAAEDSLENYQKITGIVSLSDETRLSLERLGTFDMEIHDSKANIEALAGQARGLEEELTSIGAGYVSLPGVEVDPEVHNILNEIEKDETELSLMEKGSGDYTEMTRKISDLKAKLRDRITLLFGADKLNDYPQYTDLSNRLSLVRAEQVAEKAKLAALQKLEKEEQSGLDILPEREMEFARLSRLVSMYETRYLNIEQQIEDMKIAMAVNLSEVTLLEQAVPPKYPLYPQILLNLILAVIAGIILSVFVIIGAEIFKRHLWTVREVSNVLPDADYCGTFGDWNL